MLSLTEPTVSTATYHPQKDLLYTTTDSTGLLSSTIYDDEDRPISSYGPAPSTWFTTTTNSTTQQTDTTPISTYSAQVPKTTTSYDQGITGTQVAWYNAKGNSLDGAPKLHTTGIITSDPTRLSFAGSSPVTPDSGMDGYGLSATGKIRFPQT
ncbi:MAG TPA: hypothetical protein VMR45_03135 [Patescibacteria group bacterium]|nr:hypothetical protein [Patescibacteria group bacterium]